MRIIKLLAAVMIAAFLFGCASAPTDPKLIVGNPPPAKTIFNYLSCTPNCTVKVNVVGDCQFEVTPLVVLSGMRGTRHAIVWVIQSGDYVFSTTGVPALDPKKSDDFFGRSVVAGPILAVQVTVSTPGMSHEYGLNIVNRSGAACPRYDPYVIE